MPFDAFHIYEFGINIVNFADSNRCSYSVVNASLPSTIPQTETSVSTGSSTGSSSSSTTTTTTSTPTTQSPSQNNLAIRFHCGANYSLTDFVRGPNLSWTRQSETVDFEETVNRTGDIGLTVAEHEVAASRELDAVLFECIANITNWIPPNLPPGDDDAKNPVNYEDSCNITLCKYV